MSDLPDGGLLRNMSALDRGLEQIASTYGEHVMLTYEDPVTFGAGHFVFYPREGSTSRFAIEEQYTNTDWSDEDRVATSWTWNSQARVRQPDGDYPWAFLANGEVAPGDYAQLLVLAEDWAKTTHELAEREQALTADPLTEPGVERPGRQRTSLS